jgi:3-phosphoshikimate 1-carboxyvinyltransferase
LNLVLSPGHPLQGTISIPGDKSLSHRALLLAAMAEGESRVNNFLVSGVTQAMLEALTALGVHLELNGTTLTVTGLGMGGFKTPSTALNCGNSATTMRLLAGMLAATGTAATLDGSNGLRRRPMNRIVEPLRQMGVVIEANDGRAPLILHERAFPLQPLDYTLPVASAQVKSCLLLAALAAKGISVVREPALSRDHTERMLRSMGVKVTSEQSILDGKVLFETRLVPPHPLLLTPLSITLPGDISSAAFLIVSALITPGSAITIKGVGLNPTRTGLLDVLLAMGAAIRISSQSDQSGEPVGDLSVSYSRLRGTRVSGETVVRMIDEFPAFAVAAAFAEGVTVVSDAEELRHKESDRISALCLELRNIGINAVESQDGFTIEGGGMVNGGAIDPHGDHRLAMSLAIAGLAAHNQVMIRQSEIITESYPEFVPTLKLLGADLATRQ